MGKYVPVANYNDISDECVETRCAHYNEDMDCCTLSKCTYYDYKKEGNRTKEKTI